jgi:hypothetical protein
MSGTLALITFLYVLKANKSQNISDIVLLESNEKIKGKTESSEGNLWEEIEPATKRFNYVQSNKTSKSISH